MGYSDAYLVKLGEESGTNTIVSSDGHQQLFSIWPNPNSGDRFFLQVKGTGLAEVQLFDALGKLQRTEQLQLARGHASVEMVLGKDMAKGLYMVRVTVEERSSVASLVIE